MNQSVWRRPHNSDPPTAERQSSPTRSQLPQGMSGPPRSTTSCFPDSVAPHLTESGLLQHPWGAVVPSPVLPCCFKVDKRFVPQRRGRKLACCGPLSSATSSEPLETEWKCPGVAWCLCVCRSSSSWEHRRLEVLPQQSALYFLDLSAEGGCVTWGCCDGTAPCLHTHPPSHSSVVEDLLPSPV